MAVQFPRTVIPVTISLAPSSSGVVCSLSQDETRNWDVYLQNLGLDIDPLASAGHITFRLRTDGKPFYPFDAMKSSPGSVLNPRAFNPLVFLGRGCKVDIFAETDAGAFAPTLAVAGFAVVLVAIGKTPILVPVTA